MFQSVAMNGADSEFSSVCATRIQPFFKTQRGGAAAYRLVGQVRMITIAVAKICMQKGNNMKLPSSGLRRLTAFWGLVFALVTTNPADAQTETTTTTIALTSGANPSFYLDSLTFTATVEASGAPVTTGTVQFKVTRRGATHDCSDADYPPDTWSSVLALDVNGQAQWTTAELYPHDLQFLNLGKDITILACYSPPDSSFSASEAQVIQTVEPISVVFDRQVFGPSVETPLGDNRLGGAKLVLGEQVELRLSASRQNNGAPVTEGLLGMKWNHFTESSGTCEDDGVGNLAPVPTLPDANGRVSEMTSALGPKGKVFFGGCYIAPPNPNAANWPNAHKIYQGLGFGSTAYVRDQPVLSLVVPDSVQSGTTMPWSGTLLESVAGGGGGVDEALSVTLRAYQASDCTGSSSNFGTVNADPLAGGAYSGSKATSNLWSFTRYLQASSESTQETYLGATSPCVAVEFCPTCGNAPPTAEANGPYSDNQGVAISLSSAGSSDTDGTIASYAWSTDAGGACSFSDASAANPTITCTSAGDYNVYLTVTDDDGAESAQDSAPLTVIGSGPCDFSLDASSERVPVGTITIDKDDDDLTFRILTDEDWCMVEWHVDIEDESTSFPTNRKGNPQVGLFENNFSGDSILDCIDDSGVVVNGPFPGDGDVDIAVHAVVYQPLGCDQEVVGECDGEAGDDMCFADYNGQLYETPLEACAVNFDETGESAWIGQGSATAGTETDFTSNKRSWATYIDDVPDTLCPDLED